MEHVAEWIGRHLRLKVLSIDSLVVCKSTGPTSHRILSSVHPAVMDTWWNLKCWILIDISCWKNAVFSTEHNDVPLQVGSLRHYLYNEYKNSTFASMVVALILCLSFTVKPVLRDHSRVWRKVVSWDKWSLNTGWPQSRSLQSHVLLDRICLLSLSQNI